MRDRIQGEIVREDVVGQCWQWVRCDSLEVDDLVLWSTGQELWERLRVGEPYRAAGWVTRAGSVVVCDPELTVEVEVTRS